MVFAHTVAGGSTFSIFCDVSSAADSNVSQNQFLMNATRATNERNVFVPSFMRPDYKVKWSPPEVIDCNGQKTRPTVKAFLKRINQRSRDKEGRYRQDDTIPNHDQYFEQRRLDCLHEESEHNAVEEARLLFKEVYGISGLNNEQFCLVGRNGHIDKR